MLEQQTNFWGSVDIYSEQPSVSIHNDVIYQPSHPLVPFREHLDWGIYSSIGQRIDAAAFRCGPGRTILGQSDWKPYPVHLAERAPRGEYLYGGVIINHYGHFICTSLSRLWHSLGSNGVKSKLVFHSSIPLNAMPSYMIELFSSLGIRRSQIYIPRAPTHFEQLTIPEPAFVEQAYGHSAAGRTFHRIGERFGPAGRRLNGANRAIYLSKGRLTSGSTRIRNEGLLEAELRRFDVEVVCPEQLTLKDQIALFQSGRTIVGQAGSGFHTSAFSKSTGKRVLLSFEQLNTNQMILDRLTFANSLYLRPLDFRNLGEFDGFVTNWDLSDPVGVARALVEHL